MTFEYMIEAVVGYVEYSATSPANFRTTESA